MNRIDKKFEQLQKEGRKALITFVTAGDPDLEVTEELILAMEKGGADIVELGVPFSDPVAEGPAVQESSLRALQNGATLKKIFETVKSIRAKTDLPLLLTLYINSIFGFGTKRFFDLCVQSGIDGVIVPDLPYEEREEIKAFAESAGVYSISTVAPTSHERIQMIAKEGKGFLYCQSPAGAGEECLPDFRALFDAVKQCAKVPAVGAEIFTPEQAKAICQYCDGVIVSSAIATQMAEYKTKAAKPVEEFVAALRGALDE